MNITKELNAILTDEMRDYGFSLKEDTDDFVCLYLGDVRIATFGQQTTIEEIHKNVNYLMEVIDVFETTFKFVEDASEYCRSVGFKDPA